MNVPAASRPPLGTTQARRTARSLIPQGSWSLLTSDAAARWLSRALLLCVWQLAGMSLERIPTPYQTGSFLVDEYSDGELVGNVLTTMERAGIALSIVLVVGVTTGILMGRWWRVRYLLSDLVMIGIALPAFIWALLAVMWWGFSDRGPIITCILSATPMLIVSTREGALAVDADLLKMSSAYNVRPASQIRSLVLPSMMQYIVAGFRIAVLAGWGAVTLVEWFGNSHGVGYRAHYWYDAGNFTGLMAWGIVMLVVIVFIDRVLMERVLRLTTRWRTSVQREWTA